MLIADCLKLTTSTDGAWRRPSGIPDQRRIGPHSADHAAKPQVSTSSRPYCHKPQGQTGYVDFGDKEAFFGFRAKAFSFG